MENLSQEFGELARRKMGMTPSNKGINATGMGSPVAQGGMNPMPQGQSGGNPLAMAASGLDQAKAGQAEMILKSLTKYLERLTQ